MKQEPFFITVCRLAIPVALQSMLQASFGIVDQIMIGQLGSVSVAGVGLAGKFSGIVSVVIGAIGCVAGIMISQYFGQKNKAQVSRSFWTNLLLGCAVAGLFTGLCILFPGPVMSLYTKDPATRQTAANYLAIAAGTFLPMTGATLLSTLLRCMEKARLPLYASMVSAAMNTGLNYLLIFGKFGFPPLGAAGAAIATVIAQCANCLLMLLMLPKQDCPLAKPSGRIKITARLDWKQYGTMLLPILVCEVVWSLGENVYAAIYGHMGTEASAAMTLINPVQGLMIGALCGLSQAASVIIGKMLGNREYTQAYRASKKLILYGAVGAAVLSGVILLNRSAYVKIYQVEPSVQQLTGQILLAYAIVAPFKVLNMILGGGILRSGGKTIDVMVIDMIGTWGFGVPLGLLAAFALKLSIPSVYFLLSLEECIRFGISLLVFRRRRWMQRLSSITAE
ncbi:MAG: MATE family efflux transporter [Faecousia sp.]